MSKKKKLELASKFGFKIFKLSSSYPMPGRYYFIRVINIGKHCTVNALWKTHFLTVVYTFCYQTDYFSPSWVQRIWTLEPEFSYDICHSEGGD